MPPRALLFAIDDCLVDWSDAIQAAVANALAVLNLSSEPLAARSLGEEITSYTWRMREGRVVERAHWRLFFEPGEPIDRAFPGYPPSMRREAARMFHAALKPALFADVLPSLSALSSRPLGVLSNSSLARVTLRRLGVLDRFAVVAIAEDPTGNRTKTLLRGPAVCLGSLPATLPLSVVASPTTSKVLSTPDTHPCSG